MEDKKQQLKKVYSEIEQVKVDFSNIIRKL